MRRQVATIMAALSALFLSALFASVPLAVHAQTDPIVDVRAVDQVMHDYVETYSRGDMAAVMKFINVPFMVAGPKGFTAFTTADEVLEWYTNFHAAYVKQGYAKTQWIDFRVKLLGQSYAITGGTYVRYKTDGSELNRSGGTYILNKVDGVWKIGVLMGYPTKEAFKLE